MSENSYLITLLQKENQTIIAYELNDKGEYTGVSHTKSFFAKANSKWKFTVIPDKFHDDYWIHIIQSDHQTITVRDNARFHDYRAGVLVSYPDDDKLTGIQAGDLDSGIYPETNYDVAREEPHDRYKYLVVNQNCRIFATLARDLYNETDYHTVTIKQIKHQTIIFTYRNKKYYTDTIVENNEDYSVEVVPDPGYTAASLIINGKTINSLKHTGKATEDLTITAAQTRTNYLEFIFKEFDANVERFNNSDGKLLVGTLQDVTTIINPDKTTCEITIIQSANQTIHVYTPKKSGGTDHTSTFTCPVGTTYEAEIIAENGYVAGILNIGESGTFNSDITINATDATVVTATVTIIQSDNQTIHVYTPYKGGTDHTSSFTCPLGTTYEVEVIADSGYTAGTPNTNGGTFNSDMSIDASPATKPQIYIAKGSNGSRWYNNNSTSTGWEDESHVIKVDESISGQATVTCDGNVTNMSYMFYACDDLTSIDLSNFDTSNVTNMLGMFEFCSLTALDLSNCDTSNVTNMGLMFVDCYNLTTIKGVFDMKSCTNYAGMFSACPKLTGVKIKNPPSGFDGAGLSSSQYTIVS